jgi:hypothetical protein
MSETESSEDFYFVLYNSNFKPAFDGHMRALPQYHSHYLTQSSTENLWIDSDYTSNGECGILHTHTHPQINDA